MTKSMNYSVGDKVRIKATKQVGTIIGLHDYHILYNVDVGTHCKWLGEIEIEKIDASAELIKGYLDLINRQQAKIEELEAKHWGECMQIAHYDDELRQATGGEE